MDLGITKVLKGCFLVECDNDERYMLLIDNIDSLKIDDSLTVVIDDRMGRPVRTVTPPLTKASFRIIPSESGELFNLIPAEIPLPIATSTEEYKYQVDKALMEYLKSFNIKEEGE